MTTMLAPLPAVAPVATPRPPAPAKVATGWLFGPAFDTLFVANLLWPLVVVAACLPSADLMQPLSLFQIYFLSSPHRWITLVLVFLDRDRFLKEPLKFGGVGIGLIALGLALVALADVWSWATDSLMLLMILDYIWNAWHFASQHAGIARIYGRMTNPVATLRVVAFEKAAIRTLVLWAFFRLALVVAGRKTDLPVTGLADIGPLLGWLDPLLLVAPLVLLVRELANYRPAARGRVLYVASVILVYSGQLVALHTGHDGLVIGFLMASAVFHATEYLAVCSWALRKKTTGVWKHQLTRTGLALAAFMAMIGIANLAIDRQSAYMWALITLLVSLLHYGYDGMIWKSRPAKPKGA